MKSEQKEKVWIVATLVDQHGNKDDQGLEDLEPSYFKSLIRGLESAGYSWDHISGPRELWQRVGRGEYGVVLPLWAGRTSRNRRALVPSTCEVLGLRYVGADPYAALVCQDKALSKGLAHSAGFDVARHHLLPMHRDVSTDSSLRPPFVVKPSMEGGSMGIDEDNVVMTHRDADELAQHLRAEWQQPILVEEFVPGREVSLCWVGPDHSALIGGAEVEVSGKPDFFEKNVYGASAKKRNAYSRRNVVIPKNQIEMFFHPLRNLVKSLGKIDFFRLDGKLQNGRFTVIELTPDAHLGESAGLAVALAPIAGGYPELLEKIIRNCDSS